MAKPKATRVRARSGRYYASNSPQGRSILAARGGRGSGSTSGS